MDAIIEPADKPEKRKRGRPRNPDGVKITAKGYRIVRQDDGEWIGEHILVMEATLGRKLRKGETVKHRNEDKLDNTPENLELWIGTTLFGIPARELACPHCGERYA